MICTRDEHLRREKQDRRHLSQTVDSKTIAILKRKFGTNKACFLPGPNGYDPMDAMRRDAYREVISWLEHAVKRGKKEMEEEI